MIPAHAPFRVPRIPLLPLLVLALVAGAPGAADAQAVPVDSAAWSGCGGWHPGQTPRNPTARELRCRFRVEGPGRFGLLSYVDVPVYQPATPMPGTHVVGLPGHARPGAGESHEEWEWRVLRTEFGPEARRVHQGLEVLHPFAASRILALEAELRREGIRVSRRETWRSPDRQAFLFQQGRSRPGFLATTTLTSWHSEVDSLGRPAGRAVDYDVAAGQLERFHEIAQAFGLSSFGHDSNDPGHVFLPAEETLPRLEIVLLRLLPRVPVVTLATGRPVDDPAPKSRAELRAQVEEFVGEPFLRHPELRIAGEYRPPAPISRLLPPAPARAAEASPVPSRPSPGGAAGDDARGGPRRSGAREWEGPSRSRDW